MRQGLGGGFGGQPSGFGGPGFGGGFSQLPGGLGGPPFQGGGFGGQSAPGALPQQPSLVTGLAFSRLEQAAQPAGGIAEKIRKALDTPVTVDFKDRPVFDVLRELHEKAPGITFQSVYPRDVSVTLHLEQVPLGAVLQALEDTLVGPNPSIGFAVREYGVLAAQQGDLPKGAVMVRDFWKPHSAADKTKASGAAKDPGDSAGKKAP
jgi:hypothetical protein